VMGMDPRAASARHVVWPSNHRRLSVCIFSYHLATLEKTVASFRFLRNREFTVFTRLAESVGVHYIQEGISTLTRRVHGVALCLYE